MLTFRNKILLAILVFIVLCYALIAYLFLHQNEYTMLKDIEECGLDHVIDSDFQRMDYVIPFLEDNGVNHDYDFANEVTIMFGYSNDGLYKLLFVPEKRRLSSYCVDLDLPTYETTISNLTNYEDSSGDMISYTRLVDLGKYPGTALLSSYELNGDQSLEELYMVRIGSTIGSEGIIGLVKCSDGNFYFVKFNDSLSEGILLYQLEVD